MCFSAPKPNSPNPAVGTATSGDMVRLKTSADNPTKDTMPSVPTTAKGANATTSVPSVGANLKM